MLGFGVWEADDVLVQFANVVGCFALFGVVLWHLAAARATGRR